MDQSSITRDYSDKLDAIIAEYIAAVERDGPQERDKWLSRYPEFAAELRSYFDDHNRVMKWVDSPSYTTSEPLQTTESFHRLGGRARRSSEPWDLQAGDTLAGKYRIVGVKQGGMGRVYFITGIANRDDTPKAVLKTVIPFGQWRSAQRNGSQLLLTARYTALLARFRREALNWIRLGEHPNIIGAQTVHEIGGRPYLFLHYADSGDLAEWIRAGRLTIPVVVDFSLQFCAGMAFAWKMARLVHRDIKPSNVLIHENKQVKITDLGLARAFAGDGTYGSCALGGEHQDDLSCVGAGTRPYMPPEQFLSLRDADTQSDVFSFGVMLFEMLTGRRLFDKFDAFEAANRGLHLPKVHEVNSSAPDLLSTVVARCVAYDREDRYRSFNEVARDLLKTGLSNQWKIKGSELVTASALAKSRRDWSREVFALLSLAQYAEADKLAQQAIQADPIYHGHWLNQGKALAELRRFDEARLCYARAAELAPDDVQCWFNLAYAFLSLKRPDEGLRAAERAIAVDANCSEAWDAAACCQHELHGPRSALHYFRRALDANSHNWRALANLGRCLSELGHDDEALSVLERSVAVNPDAENSWFQIACILGQKARFAEALQANERCLHLDNENAAAWTSRGLILLRTGSSAAQLSGAADCFRRAVALAPNDSTSAKLLARVQARLNLQDKASTQ
jgi:serine/threonine protein kinase/Flp pilus assembly protein TadD